MARRKFSKTESARIGRKVSGCRKRWSQKQKVAVAIHTVAPAKARTSKRRKR